MIFNRLLTPWLRTTINRYFRDRNTTLRSLIILLVTMGICLVISLGSNRVLGYFHSQNELGILLSLKILQMLWLLLFTMLIFSSMVTSVSTLYLSEDNEILLSSPAPPREILKMRFLTTTVTTSWMVVIFSLPVFGAYGSVFDAGALFFPLVVLCLLTISLIAAAFATGLTISLIHLFPAKRTKDIVLYLSLCFGLFLYLIFRMMRPEDLVNPDRYGEFIEYFSAISSPTGPWVPAGWASSILTTYLLDRKIDFLFLALLITTPAALYIFCEWLMDRFFFTGFSKSQESFGGHRRFRRVSRWGNTLAWIFRKELRQFTRDSTQWSQFFMIAALIVVYLYNFRALPLDRSPLPTVFITNLIAFGNIGLAGFLAASLATRFVYPAVSDEKGAFYLIRGGPISLLQFVGYKYLFYALPFTLMTIILAAGSNHLLQVTGPMWWISLFASLLITWTVLGLGLGFGCFFADFKTENKAMVMGPGSILFLLTAVVYELIILGSGVYPCYRLVRNSARHLPLSLSNVFLMCGWIAGAVTISLCVTVLVLRTGLRKLEE